MSAATAPALAGFDAKSHLLEQYGKRIDYYWRVAGKNKRQYMSARFAMVILGALVTLLSSLGSAEVLKGWPAGVLAVLTPLTAAVLTVATGFSQQFQWGPAWSEMVLTATKLESERNRIFATADADLNLKAELASLDAIVMAETKTFFGRLFGSASDKAGG